MRKQIASAARRPRTAAEGGVRPSCFKNIIQVFPWGKIMSLNDTWMSSMFVFHPQKGGQLSRIFFPNAAFKIAIKKILVNHRFNNKVEIETNIFLIAIFYESV